MSTRTPFHAAVAASSLVVALSVTGCETTPSPDLDMTTKAKLTRNLRKEADDCLGRWTQSDGSSIEDLECFEEKHRLTVEMYPSPAVCPLCYANHAQGLRLLGVYYWTLRRKCEDEIERTSDPSALAELEAKRARADEMVRSYFAESNRQLEAFFSTRQAVIPQTYDWASQQYAELGDYRRALRYLDLLTQSRTFGDETQGILDKRRREYRKRLQQQQMQRVRDELGGADAAGVWPDADDRGGRRQP